MGARFINNDGTPIKKVVGAKKQYENINGVFVPVFYDGYILYNSLTTDGTAYIDLGHKGYGNNTHIIDFTLTTRSGYVGVYGNRVDNGNRFGVIYNKDNNTVYVENQVIRFENQLILSAATLGRYLVTLSATKTTVLHDGVLNEKIYTMPVCSETYNNLEVFRYPDIRTPNAYYQGISTVHSIKEYSEQGVLLYHYVPAKRISDGELGLMDVVNGVFYTNMAGSGSFSV